MIRTKLAWAFVCCLTCAGPFAAAVVAEEPNYTRKEDVVYGRKHGMALTMDVLTPKEKPNGAAIVWMISGGWYSAHEAINPGYVAEYLKRGYTVFAVVHGSQPKFTIPEAVDDVNRAVRYIRYHAGDYGIDPNRIGVTGASAGGHLSLMLGTAGGLGNPIAKDPVDRDSSRVQAVACYFPPTDFFNYGKPGERALGEGVLKGFKAPFDFNALDAKDKIYRPVDEGMRETLGHQISPITHVSPDDPPTLIMHGDADQLVPIQQAETIIAKMKEKGVEAKLVVKPGESHGWKDLINDQAILADWFDEHLKAKPKTP
ncbi:alpha/beta hydrolase [Paludisphaera rhizosphaerae]|uniref:alpha/beta hydrolase n=1 Tax=Paludisphaera rhizosphaerae TaxID=2711216 RepID=UPI0013EAE40B|nr:alpha/beta hydrolase [Paludisphaera rhizosphaerae]